MRSGVRKPTDGAEMIKGKKSVALVDYKICSPNECNPDGGICAAVEACSKVVLEQIDGPLDVIEIKHNF